MITALLVQPLSLVFYALLAFGLFAIVPPRFKMGVLLGLSLLFWALLLAPILWLALAWIVLGTFGVGLRIGRSTDEVAKRHWLRAGLGLDLGVLLFFRYAHGWPAFVGLSYLVFQSLGYLLDVYFGTVPFEPVLSRLGLFLCFFPKAIQGPIERSGPLQPQLRAPSAFDYGAYRQGLLLLAWGLFQKTVIADRLATLVDPVVAHLGDQSGPALLLALYGFTLQLFCDFSGYTDMALGAALLFGIRLSRNFDAPFLAVSIQDFWKRWHISLSTWILDFVFEPLQMAFRNAGLLGSLAAIFIAFFCIGLWHGATWCFVAFGSLQGFYMVCIVLYRPWKKRLHKALGWAGSPWQRAWQAFFTFHLVCASFIFFKAQLIGDALRWAKGLFQGWDALALGAIGAAAKANASKSEDLWVLSLGLGLLLAVHVWHARWPLAQRPFWLRWTLYLGLAFSLLFFGRFFAEKQFIYAQF